MICGSSLFYCCHSSLPASAWNGSQYCVFSPQHCPRSIDTQTTYIKSYNDNNDVPFQKIL